MKKVLFVSYYYPPLGGVGAQRILRFIKYLPDYGWEPFVLTAEPSPFLPLDEIAVDILPEQRVVHAEVMEPLSFAAKLPFFRGRKKIEEVPRDARGNLNLKALKEGFRELPLSRRGKIRSWLFVPDDRIGWLPDGTRAGLGLMNRVSFDCLLSTSAPYSAHLLALRLAKRKRIPWLADFRDLWATNTFLHFPSRLHVFLNSLLEKLVINQADRVLTCTPLFREDFLLRYPALAPEKFSCITNGFDPADFPSPQPEPYPRFTISYVGDFYGPQTPIFFLLGLKAFFEKHPETSQELQVLFVGPFEERVRPIVETLELQEVVRFLGFLPHEHSVAVMRRSHVLLLVLGQKTGGEKIYPAKLFEYLAAKKPILALVPEGLTKDLLKKSGVSFMVNPQSEDSIAIALERLFLAYKDGSLPKEVPPTDLALYDAKVLTSELSKLMEETIEMKKRALSLKGKKS